MFHVPGRLERRDDVVSGWVRPAPNASQRRADIVVGTIIAGGSVVSDVIYRALGIDLYGPRPSLSEEILWCLAATLPLTVRRRFPLAVLGSCSLAFFALQTRQVGEPLISQIGLFLALFTAGAWARERYVGQVVRGVIVALMFCWVAYVMSITKWDEIRQDAPDGPIAAVIAYIILFVGTNVLYFGGAWAFGDMAWRSAAQRALLEQRNTELAVERDENARRAVLDERVRIARELHDVVAHHVSVMGVQAGAARMVLDHDPDAARTALSGIEQVSRDAVTEMRRLLGVLRDVPARRGQDGGGVECVPAAAVTGTVLPDPPSPGIGSVCDLVSAGRAAGLHAECTVVGEPFPLPPSLSVSAYRIVQEAVTNTIRHAGASRLDIRVRYLAGPGPASEVEVEVVDDGQACPQAAEALSPALGSGLGLVGMRERAAMHDAEIEIGPRPERGFRVRVRFPVPERTPAAVKERPRTEAPS